MVAGLGEVLESGSEAACGIILRVISPDGQLLINRQTGSCQLARRVSIDKRASSDRCIAGEKPTQYKRVPPLE
jgi:hypothetical protein